MAEAGAIGTGTDDLRVRIEAGVAVLTMNRPERRNALSAAMFEALGTALANAEADPAVRCVVLTGAGGAFCAGADVKGMAERQEGAGQGEGPTLDDRIQAQRRTQRATAGRIFRMPKPVIAMIPGAAAGAGLSLALACDLRYMSAGAVLTTAFAKVGFSGDYGGTYFLSQIVGTAKARELYFLSDRVPAAEALRLGLVNDVFPDEELEARTLAVARRLAERPAIAYRYMKENLNRALQGADPLECLDLEATHHVHTGQTEDHRAAVHAFVAKTPPVFRGR